MTYMEKNLNRFFLWLAAFKKGLVKNKSPTLNNLTSHCCSPRLCFFFFYILIIGDPDHCLSFTLLILSGNLRLRLARVSYEVNRSADFGASDLPHASEHNAALCQTQPQD